MTIAYTYGGFNLNDFSTYFVDGIDLSPPPVTPTTFQVARNPGLKKTGEIIGEKKFSLVVSVLSPDSTRAGLRQALDTLNAALMGKRQQQIVLQDDSRYMIGDCVQMQTLIKNPNYVAVQCDFECYQPFAYAVTPSTATITGTMSGSGPYTIIGSITGGGTQTALPAIVITNTSAYTFSQLTLANLTQNASITPVGLTLAPGDYCTIYCDPGAANALGWTISKNGLTSTLYDFSGIFPAQDVGADIWQISVQSSTVITSSAFIVGVSSVGSKAYLGGGVSPTPTISAVFTWTPIYLA